MSVENFIADNATETEILAWLGRACTVLPSEDIAACVNAVNIQGPEIIKWIEANENPEAVCAQLSLCPTAKFVGDDTECTVCEFLAVTVENYLAQNSTEVEIEQALTALCNDLPGISAICTGIVDAYLPELIDWIIQGQPPNVFCSQVGLCSSSLLLESRQD